MNRVILDPVSKRFMDTGEKIRRFGKDAPNFGKHHSDEARKKIGLAQKGERHHMFGKHHSDETKEKISLTQRGKKSFMFGKHPSEETKEKMSLAQRGEKNPWFGKHFSNEHKEKLSIAHLGKHFSDEHKEKLSIANSNPSEETREKIGLANRGEKSHWFGKRLSEEAKEKLSLAGRAYFQDPEFVKRYIKGHGKKPNKAEIYLQSILDEHLPNTYKYVGDFQVNIGGKFPDYININGRKEVIELFGSYWHSIEEIEPTISHYKHYGYPCIIIWEEELKDVESLLEHIRSGSIYQPRQYRENRKTREVKKLIILDSVTKMFSQVGSNVKNRD